MKKIVLGIVIILSAPSFALTLEKQVEYIEQVKSFNDTQRTIKITAGIFELIWQCSVAGIKDTFFAGIQDIADNSTDDFSFGGLVNASFILDDCSSFFGRSALFVDISGDSVCKKQTFFCVHVFGKFLFSCVCLFLGFQRRV